MNFVEVKKKETLGMKNMENNELAANNIKRFGLDKQNLTGAGSPDVSAEVLAVAKPMKRKFKLSVN